MTSVHDRDRMVREQLERRGIRDARVLAAMRETPRELFVDAEHAAHAYDDSPLPIGRRQTISQPYVVALMCEALELVGHERVLEIGTGSGYAAAVLGRLAREVHSIERHASLAEVAARRLRHVAADVHVHVGDGTKGLPSHAPFDAIVVTAGGPAIPQALSEQLAVGGRLVMPVGDRSLQRLVRLRRLSEGRVVRDDLGDVRFVPLVGEDGWPEPSSRDGSDG